MTLALAQSQLVDDLDGLAALIGDLALIAFEDQPPAPIPVAFDDLINETSEVQGSVAAARACAAAGAAGFENLTETDFHLDAARSRYWRSFRSYESVASRRVASRRAGGLWPAWLDSVEKSAHACEASLEAAAAAMRMCWQEICQLLVSTQMSGQPPRLSEVNQVPLQQHRRKP